MMAVLSMAQAPFEAGRDHAVHVLRYNAPVPHEAGLPDTSPLQTLMVFCRKCGQPVTLTMSGFPNTLDHTTRVWKENKTLPAHWACPHCQQENQGGFPGRIQFATKGHRNPAWT